jgi:hypothetical protein
MRTLGGRGGEFVNLQLEVIRRLEKQVGARTKPLARGIFEVNNKRINIRSASDKGSQRYWFDVTPSLYTERKVDYLLFTCGYPDNTYVFPVETFSTMIEGASLGGQKQVPNFNIRLDSHKFEPCGLKGKKFDIKTFFNHFDQLRKDSNNISLLESIVVDDIDAFQTEERFEGGMGRRYINYYERDPKLRAAAVLIHGTNCTVCKFNFEEFYGKRGAEFIEVHHLRPVSSLKEKVKVNPKTDMTVLCSNCHRMIHRKKNNILSVEELKRIVEATRMAKRSTDAT